MNDYRREKLNSESKGVEVKSGEPLKVTPGDGMVLYLSQACLSELKKEKGNESVYLFVSVEGKKLVLGTLFTDELPQQQFDLVFDRDLVLKERSFFVLHFQRDIIRGVEGYIATGSKQIDIGKLLEMACTMLGAVGKSLAL